jgi:hypothetical protein
VIEAQVFLALFWGALGGVLWSRGVLMGVAAICDGKRSFWPLIAKCLTIGCLYIGLRGGAAHWPYVLAGLVVSAVVVFGGGLVARRRQLR